MQIYAINGSPRKKWNTAQVLQAALDGAAEANPDVLTEMINLYDLKYKGCVECFECKRINGPSYGKCAIKDEIHQLLQNVVNADAVIFGSPIYFSDITGMLRCFLERLFFPLFVYDKNYSSLAPKKLRTAFFYTMNVNEDLMKKMGYPERFSVMEGFAKRVFKNDPEILYVNDTLQFPDYSKYMNSIFSPEVKKKRHDEQLPLDCQRAKEIGAALVTPA